ncbi:MAG: hypothetical protein NT027_14625 [Proteobacteria bacterium]|nr:hypothetical protein [Pseudomonadota bacterium]
MNQRRYLGRGLYVVESSKELRIVHSWFGFMVFASGVIGLIFLGLATRSVLTLENVTGRRIAEIVISGGCALGLLYTTLCFIFNRSILLIEGDNISRWSEPFPPFGREKLKSGDIESVKVVSREGSIGSDNTPVKTIRLDIEAMDSSGKSIVLVGNVRTYKAAKEIEALIAQRLNLEVGD